MKIIIKGMSCGHCSSRVQKALTALGLEAAVDLASGSATVIGNVDVADIRAAIEDVGFEVVGVE